MWSFCVLVFLGGCLLVLVCLALFGLVRSARGITGFHDGIIGMTVAECKSDDTWIPTLLVAFGNLFLGCLAISLAVAGFRYLLCPTLANCVGAEHLETVLSGLFTGNLIVLVTTVLAVRVKNEFKAKYAIVLR